MILPQANSWSDFCCGLSLFQFLVRVRLFGGTVSLLVAGGGYGYPLWSFLLLFEGCGYLGFVGRGFGPPWFLFLLV
jgi:hypothetical protein